jgi:hypothetical protein
LCEEVLKDIRRPQQWAASEAARSSVLTDPKSDRRLGIGYGTRDRPEALPQRPRSFLHPPLPPLDASLRASTYPRT